MEDFVDNIWICFLAAIQLPTLPNFVFELNKTSEALYLEFETNQSITTFVIASRMILIANT